ncbi:hypothetical protein AAFX60_018685 [Aliivibrio fischeri]
MGANWEYSKTKGREMRLEAELRFATTGEPVPTAPPLFSHDATMQSLFSKAWNRVTPVDIRVHCQKDVPIQPKGDRLSKLRSLRKCHFH